MQSNLPKTQIPIPKHFDPSKVGEVWRIPYQERINQARKWKKQHDIRPASEDAEKTMLTTCRCSEYILYTRIRVIRCR